MSGYKWAGTWHCLWAPNSSLCCSYHCSWTEVINISPQGQRREQKTLGNSELSLVFEVLCGFSFLFLFVFFFTIGCTEKENGQDWPRLAGTWQQLEERERFASNERTNSAPALLTLSFETWGELSSSSVSSHWPPHLHRPEHSWGVTGSGSGLGVSGQGAARAPASQAP